MTKKRIILHRIDVKDVVSRKTKPLNVKRIMQLADRVKKAVEREEELYGKLGSI